MDEENTVIICKKDLVSDMLTRSFVIYAVNSAYFLFDFFVLTK